MELTGEKREKVGRQSKSLRKESKIPAVIFGPEMESVNISIGKHPFKKILEVAGETSLIDLNLEKETYKVLVKDVQHDPVSSAVIHVGFYKPNLLEKIHAEIPVEVVGEDINPLIKSGEALVLTLMEEIEVEALPTDLPHAFEVDVSALAQVGDGITVSQLKYDRDKVEIIDLEPDTLVIKLDYAEMQEEEEAAPVSEEEAVSKIEATEESTDEKDGEEEEEK